MGTINVIFVSIIKLITFKSYASNINMCKGFLFEYYLFSVGSRVPPLWFSGSGIGLRRVWARVRLLTELVVGKNKESHPQAIRGSAPGVGTMQPSP